MIPFLAAIVAALIGIAGYLLYSDAKTSHESAAGTVAPAVRHKGEPAQSAGGQPAAPNAASGQQSGLMQPASQSPRDQLELKLGKTVGNAPAKQEARPEYKTQ